jgi:DNA processing protein
MCDAVVVVETGIKGGSLITADLANGYNRDVFAYPGKITDSKSAGCNMLIRNHKAILLEEPQQLVETMKWDHKPSNKNKQPKLLFNDLSEHELKIVSLLEASAPLHIDELMLRSGMSSSLAASVILGLELKSIVNTLPGKRLSLV